MCCQYQSSATNEKGSKIIITWTIYYSILYLVKNVWKWNNNGYTTCFSVFLTVSCAISCFSAFERTSDNFEKNDETESMVISHKRYVDNGGTTMLSIEQPEHSEPPDMISLNINRRLICVQWLPHLQLSIWNSAFECQYLFPCLPGSCLFPFLLIQHPYAI